MTAHERGTAAAGHLGTTLAGGEGTEDKDGVSEEQHCMSIIRTAAGHFTQDI
jgi:hypothetical protein